MYNATVINVCAVSDNAETCMEQTGIEADFNGSDHVTRVVTAMAFCLGSIYDLDLDLDLLPPLDRLLDLSRPRDADLLRLRRSRDPLRPRRERERERERDLDLKNVMMIMTYNGVSLISFFTWSGIFFLLPR